VLVGKPASPKRRVLDLFIRLNAYAGAAWAFDMYQVAIGVVSETRGPEVTSCRLRDKSATRSVTRGGSHLPVPCHGQLHRCCDHGYRARRRDVPRDLLLPIPAAG